MPDFAVCNSTLCTVRANCRRNWDSGLLSDREAMDQTWVTFAAGRSQPGPEPYKDTPVTHHDDCPMYLPIIPGYPPTYIPFGKWETDPRYAYRFNHTADGTINMDKMTPEVRAAFEDGLRLGLRKALLAR